MYSVRPGRASTGLQSKLPRIACDSGGPLRASSGPQEETTTHSGRFGSASTGLKRGSTGNYQVCRVIRAGLNGPQEGLKSEDPRIAYDSGGLNGHRAGLNAASTGGQAQSTAHSV